MSTERVRIAIVGYGKIARDQHVPAIAASDRFELWAAADPAGDRALGAERFASHRELLQARESFDAVAVATPAAARHAIARDCLEAGLHVLLEKPPGITTAEVEDLAALAEERGLTLFTTWHSRYNPAIDAAARALAGKRLRRLRAVWREDVRRWHPGQRWIWEPGGFGVFDPGINALAIITRIVDGALFVRAAELTVPANKAMPIAAQLSLGGDALEEELSLELDWREQGAERWVIEAEAVDGTALALTDGGSRLAIGGTEVVAETDREYPWIYARFAELIDAGRSLVDVEPLRLVTDALAVGERVTTDEFHD